MPLIHQWEIEEGMKLQLNLGCRAGPYLKNKQKEEEEGAEEGAHG